MPRILAGFIVLLLPLIAWADMAPLRSHKKVLGNGKFVLVMLYTKANGENAVNELNTIYPQSGLYPNDNTRKPIWTLPNAFEGQVFLSRDGEYLANSVFPSQCNGDGLRFYHKGKLIRSYKITDLVHKSACQEACPSCIWHGLASFNDDSETITLEVNDGRTWNFNLRTGEGSARGGGVALFGGGNGATTLIWLVVLAAGLFGIIAIGGLIGGYLYWQ